MDPTERFLCHRLACTLTRSACAERHKTIPKKQGPCATCPDGAAHARGELPASTSAAVHTPAPQIPPATTRDQSPPAPPAEERMPKSVAKTYPYRGRNLTLAELAELAGCKPEAMRMRLRKHPTETAVGMGAAAPAGVRAAPETSVQATPVTRVVDKAAGPVERAEHPLSALLEAAGYRLLNATRVPRGLALIIEAPAP